MSVNCIDNIKIISNNIKSLSAKYKKEKSKSHYKLSQFTPNTEKNKQNNLRNNIKYKSINNFESQKLNVIKRKLGERNKYLSNIIFNIKNKSRENEKKCIFCNNHNDTNNKTIKYNDNINELNLTKISSISFENNDNYVKNNNKELLAQINNYENILKKKEENIKIITENMRIILSKNEILSNNLIALKQDKAELEHSILQLKKEKEFNKKILETIYEDKNKSINYLKNIMFVYNSIFKIFIKKSKINLNNIKAIIKKNYEYLLSEKLTTNKSVNKIINDIRNIINLII